MEKDGGVSGAFQSRMEPENGLCPSLAVPLSVHPLILPFLPFVKSLLYVKLPKQMCKLSLYTGSSPHLGSLYLNAQDLLTYTSKGLHGCDQLRDVPWIVWVGPKSAQGPWKEKQGGRLGRRLEGRSVSRGQGMG